MTATQLAPGGTLVVPTSNRRRRTLAVAIAAAVGLVAVFVAGTLVAEVATTNDLLLRNQPPSLAHPFGTDWMGRDVLARTLVGLRLSLVIGCLAAASSSILALALAAVAAGVGGWADRVVGWLVDLFLALPHLVLLILLTFALGGGAGAVTLAIAVTHWPTLTRVLRGEGRRAMQADWAMSARRLGNSRLAVARRHLPAHLLPQYLVGLVLLFPHVILHEAALSFLGLGLSPHEPAIGIMLGESMRHLSAGAWWLAVFPGACLLLLVKTFEILGSNLSELLDPRSHHL